MLQKMTIPKGGGLLLAGLAAFAYYKYSKMSEEEKRNLVNNLKEKGRKLYDSLPDNLKNMFGKKEQADTLGYETGNNYAY